MARNDLENSNQGPDNPLAAAARPGHRIREIRQDLRRRHHIQTGYQLAHPATHQPPASLLPVTSDEYQVRLYRRSRSADPLECLTAVREAIATSPYTWEDLSADGVKDWVEESVSDDVLLAAGLESLGELALEERPYLGKFIVERIYEILTDGQARYWFRRSGRKVHTSDSHSKR